MWFESTEGVGSTFYFKLPMTCTEGPNREYEVLLRGKTVLVVESNDTLLQAIALYLKSIGIAVTIAQDNITSRKHMEHTSFNAIILGRSHLNLLEERKEIPCVVICSSYAEYSNQTGVYYLSLPLRYSKLYPYKHTN
jgi:hypothetical protein